MAEIAVTIGAAGEAYVALVVGEAPEVRDSAELGALDAAGAIPALDGVVLDFDHYGRIVGLRVTSSADSILAPSLRESASTSRINHVSVNALDLAESVGFYVELLGAEPIATPNFGLPVQWLALGPTQLHLYERDIRPPSHHHVAITVGDLEPAYRAAERRDAFDRDAFGNHLVELPGDVIQLYVRDPAGNLVELDHPGKDSLPDDLRAQVKALWDLHPQDDENMAGRLFVP
jgi:catechol 2,3-dioxygenase-like lactoylglutathione lyase family enzyme